MLRGDRKLASHRATEQQPGNTTTPDTLQGSTSVQDDGELKFVGFIRFKPVDQVQHILLVHLSDLSMLLIPVDGQLLSIQEVILLHQVSHVELQSPFLAAAPLLPPLGRWGRLPRLRSHHIAPVENRERQ